MLDNYLRGGETRFEGLKETLLTNDLLLLLMLCKKVIKRIPFKSKSISEIDFTFKS